MKDTNVFTEITDAQSGAAAGGSGADRSTVWKKSLNPPTDIAKGIPGCPQPTCKDEHGKPTGMIWDGNPVIRTPEGESHAYLFHCPNCHKQYAKLYHGYVDGDWYESVY